jgi:methionyl-tRNA synthetase
MVEKRQILITAALPYANGDIHIGHMVEHLIVDFQNRYQKMRGHDCMLICADDTHGTPVMLSARQKGISPEELIEKVRTDHIEDFRAFEVQHDHYGSTHSASNRELVGQIYTSLQKSKSIVRKTIQQLYCTHDQMFLPDRFVKGTCPKCKSPDQYGDSCDVCGATYQTTELIEPKCSLCGNSPEIRSTEHMFFRLESFRSFLKEWVPAHTPADVTQKLQEWLSQEFQDWCISRDAPYFGFEIPGETGKFFYVWVDAPVGYMSSSLDYCRSKAIDWDTYWRHPKSNTEVYHCIGKDIVYFHTLFWPAMLKAAEFRLPKAVWIHGMLTVNGTKMSKSKGTMIPAKTFVKHLSPLYFRYYLASKLSDTTHDIDWNFEDFSGRVNAELVGKITNIASRSAQMLQKLSSGLTTMDDEGRSLCLSVQRREATIAEHYESRQYMRVIQEIREAADDVNKYFDTHQPWVLVKSDEAKTKSILTASLNVFRLLSIFLKPILPSYVSRVEALFKSGPFQWSDYKTLLENHAMGPFEHLIKRIEPSSVESMVQETLALSTTKAPQPATAATSAHTTQKTPDKAPTKSDTAVASGVIQIDDFMKIDLRVARIAHAEAVEGAEKLLKLTLDLGDSTRQVFSGIKAAYQPEQLIGRLTIMVANLQPRKMKFGMSEGMVLAAGPGGKDIFLLQPDQGAKPGDRVQ